MNVKRLAVLLLGCLAMLFLATNPASATCSVSFLNVSVPPDLNAEGIAERGADIVISGAGCFTSGTTIVVGYNAIMTYPTSIGLGDLGTYWDLSDSTESLSVASISVGTQVVSTGTVSDIIIKIDVGTDNPAASISLENLRFDVTGSTCKSLSPPCQSVGDGYPLNAVVAGTNPTFTLTPFDIGNVKKTVSAAAVLYTGWGFEDGVCPFRFCGYPNKAATTGSLIAQAWWYMQTNPAWVTDFAFRRVGETSPNLADPYYIGPTDLVINVENIMAGVTVSLPSALNVCTSEYGPIATWTFARGSQTTTGGNLVGIYQTTYSNLTNPVYLEVATTNGPADPGCDSTSFYPLISVVIGNPSGDSPDGTMQAYLNVLMGPATTAQFTGDDAVATAVPRYLNDISPTDRPTRDILGVYPATTGTGTSVVVNPYAAPYFFLNPTQTVLLYPYVTNLDGWDTGIEVANTGLDGAVFGNTGQTGALDFYFFPTPSSSSSGTPFVCSTVTSADIPNACDVGRGLNASNLLAPGGDYAVTLNVLLGAAEADGLFPSGGNFDGYLIIVAHFNFGHGNGMLFGSSGQLGTVPALILGGHCNYKYNQSPTLVTGAPGWPACSSARTGDITQLPESLDN